MCLHFTFIIAVPFSPKYVTSILCIYGLFAAEGKQQGSDTLEAVNCRSPRRSCCSTCSDLQIKAVFFFHFGSVFCSVELSAILTYVHQGAETPQRQELRKPEQNTIFIHYIHYIQCNTTRLSTHSLYPQSSAHWSESTSLKTPESNPGVQRRARWKEKKREEEKITFHPANIAAWRIFTLQ